MLRGRRVCDHMVDGFTTTYAISTFHHLHCEFESSSGEVYLIQHYVIKFVSDLRQVDGFLGSPISSTNKTDCHDINVVESGVKHHKPNQTYSINRCDIINVYRVHIINMYYLHYDKGMLEYQEKIKSSGPAQPKLSRQLQCQLSIGAADGEM